FTGQVISRPDAEARAVISEMVAKTLSGEPVVVEVRGGAGYSDAIDAYFLENFVQYVTIEGMKYFAAVIESGEIVESHNDYIEMISTIRVNNTSQIEGNMGSASLDMMYRDGNGKEILIGKAEIDNLIVKRGNESISQQVRFYPIRYDILGTISSKTMSGEDALVYLKGSPSGTLASRILSRSLTPVKISSHGSIEITMTESRIISSNGTAIVTEITGSLSNNCPIRGNISSYDILIKYNTTCIGNATMYRSYLVPGTNTVKGICTISPENENLCANMLSQYFSGNTTSVRTEGIGYILPGMNALQKILAYTSMNLKLKGADGPMATTTLNSSLVSTTPNSLISKMTIRIDNPSIITGTVGPLNFSLYTEGERSAGTPVKFAEVSIKSVSFEKGSSILEVEAELFPSDNRSIGQLGTALFRGEEPLVWASGNPNDNLLVSRLLAQYCSPVRFNTTSSSSSPASSPSSSALKMEINRTVLHSYNNTAIDFTSYVDIENPTPLTGEMKDIYFRIYTVQKGSGDISQRRFAAVLQKDGGTLYHGKFQLADRCRLECIDESVVRALLSDILNGTDVDITLEAWMEKVMGGLLVAEMNMTLRGYGGLKVEMNETRLIDSRPGSIISAGIMDIYNPAPIEGTFYNLTFLMNHNGKQFGRLKVNTLNLTTGWNRVTTDTILTDINESLCRALISRVLSGNNETITTSGDIAAADMMSRLFSAHITTIQLNTGGKVTIDPIDIAFVSSSSRNITMNMNFYTSNPTFFSSEQLILTGRVYYNQRLLGNLTTTPMEIKKERAMSVCTFTLQNPDTLLGADMMASYLNGNTIEFQVIGSQSKNIMSGLPELFILNFSITGRGRMDMTLSDVIITQIEEDHVHMLLNLSISNPSIIHGMMGNLSFSAYWNNTHASDFIIRNLTLNQGNYTISLESIGYPQNTSIVTDMLNHLFDGNSVELVMRGRMKEGEILSSFMSGYQRSVLITSTGPLDVYITNMSIAGGVADTLYLNINLSIFNPTSMSVHTNTIYLDLFENNSRIGDIIIPAGFISSGQNYVSTLTMLYGNRSHISRMLSDHINGTDIYFTVRGNTTHDPGFVAQAIAGVVKTVVLRGVNQPLITSIRITNMVIQINLGVTAYMNVSFQNPTSFNFNLTYFRASVYFDDPDGASFMYIWNYPPAYNIYMGQVENSYILTPIYMTAAQHLTIQSLMEINNFELEVRLYDEYYSKNTLYVDVSGYIMIRVGTFEVQVFFSQQDIWVPNTSK
ncbi:MAG: hypothetical protein QW728_04635, partial [Thermoplasmata archaeon]